VRTPAEPGPVPLGQRQLGYADGNDPRATRRARPRVALAARRGCGSHHHHFLGEWRGALVCDDYSGYKALLAKGIVEAGCLAHARRKFVELHTANKSHIAEAGIQYFARLYEIEREVKDLDADERHRIRQARGRPIAEALHAWMIAQRLKVPEGSGTAKAI
jgi:transposase